MRNEPRSESSDEAALHEVKFGQVCLWNPHKHNGVSNGGKSKDNQDEQKPKNLNVGTPVKPTLPFSFRFQVFGWSATFKPQHKQNQGYTKNCQIRPVEVNHEAKVTTFPETRAKVNTERKWNQ